MFYITRDDPQHGATHYWGFVEGLSAPEWGPPGPAAKRFASQAEAEAEVRKRQLRRRGYSKLEVVPAWLS